MHQHRNLILKTIKEIPASLRASLELVFDQTEGCISFEEATLLYCLASLVRHGCIVEVGSYRGRSTVFLGRGSLDGSQVPVYAIDPHKNFVGILGGVFGPQDRSAFYRAMLDNECSEITSLINLSSENFTSMWKESVALLWIDGDHSYEGVKRDFESWRGHLSPDAIIAFDDAADPQLGPWQLINELKQCDDFLEIITVGKISVLCKKSGKMKAVQSDAI